MTSPHDRHRFIFEVFFGAEDGRGPDPRDGRFGACMRCWALQRGKTSAEDVALAEDALGPHVCEADPRKIIVWIAKDSSGEIRSGIKSSSTEEISVRTPRGWKHVTGHLGIHVSHERAAEASGEMCVRAHRAGLMHCDVDDCDPWPDADGPWRLEVPLSVLESP